MTFYKTGQSKERVDQQRWKFIKEMKGDNTRSEKLDVVEDLKVVAGSEDRTSTFPVWRFGMNCIENMRWI